MIKQKKMTLTEISYIVKTQATYMIGFESYDDETGLTLTELNEKLKYYYEEKPEYYMDIDCIHQSQTPIRYLDTGTYNRYGCCDKSHCNLDLYFTFPHL